MKKLNNQLILSLLGLVIVFTTFLSCLHNRSVQADIRYVDSLVIHSSEPRVKLTDSLLQAGVISQLAVEAYNYELYLEATKEFGDYMKRIYELKPTSKMDRIYHLRIAKAYIYFLTTMSKYDAAMQIFTDEQAQINLDDLENTEAARSYTAMQCLVGICSLQKQLFSEGEQLLKENIDKLEMLSQDSIALPEFSADVYRYSVMAMSAFYNHDQYEKALEWTERTERLLKSYRERSDARESLVAFMESRIDLSYSSIYAIQGKKKEAAEYYKKYISSKYNQSDVAQINTIDYLLSTGQYAKAADICSKIESLIAKRNMSLTIGNIVSYLAPKYKANLLAGRRDTAMAVASKIIYALDSAAVWANRDKSIELATLYETKQKEQKIAEQEASLNQQRIIGLLVAIVLLTFFFIVYTALKRRSARRLAEMKTAQERIESELRIARDIQMSMVPHQFPNYEGLELYASMTPAKEVGGDLYGYVIRDQMLYFAVGDVSGKGVPASLFMAQATRLFRTMANQGLLPADICTHMNNELSGDDNINGMFVTMFIGMLDMQTGHLKFCNAGHNPPIIGGGENQGDFLKMEPNAPIGLWPDLEYVGEEIDTIKGRALFIYTDGLNEAEDQEQKQFGDDHLLAILRNTHFDTAQQVIETLAAQVEQHRNGAEPNDDLTMMCLRVK